jgi:hypothetical protein
MKTTLQSQFDHEHKAWERSLEFFRQENAILKYRLSEMVDNNEENNFLQMAEYFQNELLLKDEMLNKLIKDLQWFSKNFDGLPKEKFKTEKIVLKREKFRNQILQFEKNFLHLFKEFNEQMLESI